MEDDRNQVEYICDEKMKNVNAQNTQLVADKIKLEKKLESLEDELKCNEKINQRLAKENLELEDHYTDEL